jgi:dTDP-4-amino-4,6-dideoxy-D-galactose acyltransferase
MINFLNWDSEFFHIKVGQITLINERFNLLNNLNIEDYDLVYLFNKTNRSIEQFLSLAPIDIKVNYEIEIQDIKISKKNIVECLSEFNKIDFENLLSLTLSSGEYSRFKVDSNFSINSFNKLYNQWLVNSINNVDKKILIVRENTVIVGILILNLKNTTSVIEILAVDKNAKRKGFASALVDEAIRISSQLNKQSVFVSTQKNNVTANLFYKSIGFRKTEEIEIYHLWK